MAAEANGTRTIGVLGGTGEQGRGLAFRLALGGHRVVLGSRDADRAQGAAEALAARVPGEASPAQGTPMRRGRPIW